MSMCCRRFCASRSTNCWKPRSNAIRPQAANLA
jgi:hypothetical protein